MHLKTRKHYLSQGLACLQSEAFFDAHEYWEIPWRYMQGNERRFWQAMIQLSVGAYHFCNNNRTGCLNLWRKALRHCEVLQQSTHIQKIFPVTALQDLLHNVLKQVTENGDPRPLIRHFSAQVVTPEWFDFE